MGAFHAICSTFSVTHRIDFTDELLLAMQDLPNQYVRINDLSILSFEISIAGFVV
jgi:hypothetical protein